jgi:D-hydroxyproline dehydrogenase subunit beta
MDGSDVVIVGGGVIGCACARHLARRGARVTLVERDHLAAGASGRNHGLLLTPTDPALVPMSAPSLPTYEEVADRSPLPLGLSPSVGFLVVAADETERRAAEAEARAAQACGVPVEHLAGDSLRTAEPALAEDVVDGWLLQDGRLIDPAALTVALSLEARDAGAMVVPGRPVRSLLFDGDAVRGVVTDDGPLRADTVVVAAGPWSGALLRPADHIPVRPARGWLVHLGPAPGLLRHVVEAGGWHPLPGDDPMPLVTAGEFERGGPAPVLGSLMQQNRDGTVLAGSSRRAALADEPEDPDTPREIARRAIRLVPALEDVPALGSWWGVRPMTPDGRPIVGLVVEGLLVATGHGGQGVMLAAGTAALVASIVAGEKPPFDPRHFSPTRFS